MIMINRIALIALMALAVALISGPAQAENTMTLVCAEFRAPTATPVPTPINSSLESAHAIKNWSSVFSMKVHPMKQSVAYGVTCIGVGIPRGSDRYRQACYLVSISYGRWVTNTTGRSNRAKIWQPLKCQDVLISIPYLPNL